MLDVIFWGVTSLMLIWHLSNAYDLRNREWRETLKSKDTMIFKDEL